MSGKLILAVLTTALVTVLCNASASSISQFTKRHVRLCLRPQFIRESAVANGSEIGCAVDCVERDPNCQGFRMTDDSPHGRCQTFEFDKCSHMVNTVSCSEFGWAYVRRRENLPDGQLCPLGYGQNDHGSTYKLLDVTSWTDGLTKCSSEPGLTKFADAMDKPENDHFHWIKTSVNSGGPYFVGGYRIGLAAMTGTWIWQACNASFVSELWMPGQPNGGSTYNRAGIWSASTAGLDDLTETYVTKALCECINPFE